MARKSKRQETCVRRRKAAKGWIFTFDLWAEPGDTVQQLFEAAEAVLIDVLGDRYPRLSRLFNIESVEHQKSTADPDWHIATIRISDAHARMEIEALFGGEGWS